MSEARKQLRKIIQDGYSKKKTPRKMLLNVCEMIDDDEQWEEEDNEVEDQNENEEDEYEDDDEEEDEGGGIFETILGFFPDEEEE